MLCSHVLYCSPMLQSHTTCYIPVLHVTVPHYMLHVPFYMLTFLFQCEVVYKVVKEHLPLETTGKLRLAVGDTVHVALPWIYPGNASSPIGWLIGRSETGEKGSFPAQCVTYFGEKYNNGNSEGTSEDYFP